MILLLLQKLNFDPIRNFVRVLYTSQDTRPGWRGHWRGASHPSWWRRPESLCPAGYLHQEREREQRVRRSIRRRVKVLEGEGWMRQEEGEESGRRAKDRGR